MSIRVDGHFINDTYNTDNDLKKVEAFSLWGRLQQQSEFTALLGMLSIGKAVKSKRLILPIGDIPSDIATLGADTTIGAVGTQFTLTLVNSQDNVIIPGTTINLVDNGVTGTGETAVVRITSAGTVAGANISFSNTEVVTNSSPAHSYTAATASLIIMAPSVPYDSTAPNPYDNKPNYVEAFMQDARQSFGRGRRQMSDSFVFDNGMGLFSEQAMDHFMRGLSNSIYFNQEGAAPNAEDYGIMTGLPGWLSVADPTATYKGHNLVVGSAATFGYKELVDYTARFTKGSKTKVMVASPATIARFLDMFRSVTTITSTQYNIPGTPIIIHGIKVDLAFLSLILIPDRGLQGNKKLFVNDGTTAAVANDFAYIVDLDNTSLVNYYVEGEGEKSVSIKPVDLSNNDTRDIREIETITTLICKDPETNGIIAFE